MIIRLLIPILALLLSVNAASAELSVTLKPGKGLKGVHSMTFHDDGKVTLLVYPSATEIVDNRVGIEPFEAAQLQQLATTTIDEYLARQDFSALKRQSLLFGIALTQGDVTKSVSSRRLSVNAIALIDAMDTLPLADHTQLYRAIGLELSQTMGGSSGVLLAIFFAAAGDASSSGKPMRRALQAGLARMRQIGGANPGDRTMVDALLPALDALKDGVGPAAVAARKGADYTATLTTAKAGRATYLNADQLHGHTDPGAEAVARLFEFLAP